MRNSTEHQDSSDKDRLSKDPVDIPKPKGNGDFRGSYGFGRRAHRPDPSARYGFEPDPSRALAPPGDVVFETPDEPDRD